MDRLIVEPKYSMTDQRCRSVTSRQIAQPGVADGGADNWFGADLPGAQELVSRNTPSTRDDYLHVYHEFASIRRSWSVRNDPHRRGRVNSLARNSAGTWATRCRSRPTSIRRKTARGTVGVRPRRHVRHAVRARRTNGASCSTTPFSTRRRVRARKQVGWFVVRRDRSTAPDEVANAIDKQFKNSSEQTRTATEDEVRARSSRTRSATSA